MDPPAEVDQACAKRSLNIRDHFMIIPALNDIYERRTDISGAVPRLPFFHPVSPTRLMMGFSHDLLVVASLAVAGGYLLNRTALPDHTLHNLCLTIFGINFFLRFIVYGLFIYPFLLNPLRHLPKVKVRVTPCTNRDAAPVY